MSTQQPQSLNPQQQSVVEHNTGPLLVVAGAGTGKTKVITDRITRLIESGVDRQSILALTFTEKATQEMIDRVAENLTDSYGAELPIYTFNGFGMEMLQEFAIEIGLSPNLTLIGDIGKVVILKEHLDSLGLDYFAPVSQPDGQLAAIADYFSLLKQQIVQPADYLALAEKLPSSDEAVQLEQQRHRELAQAFDRYCQLTKQRNVIDYDDQIYLLVQLLEDRPNIRELLQQRYQYILVDEFQDTNPMQSRLLDLLVGKERNLMVVGDDDQSIYGWRGATLANILQFTERYSDTEQIALIKNYRSTQAILDGAYRLIQHNNPDRLEVINDLDKQLQAERGRGQPPHYKGFSRFDLELDWVARDIKDRIQAGADPGQIAVLARRSHGVNLMHEALDLAGVEHTVVGVARSLYDHPLVESMIQAIRASLEPQNITALYHTLTGPLFSFDAAVVGRIAQQAHRQFVPFVDLVSETDQPELISALSMIDDWRQQAATTSVGRLAYSMIDQTGLKDRVIAAAESSAVDHESAQALFQWFNTLRSFETISELSSPLGYLDNLGVIRAEGELLDEEVSFGPVDQPVVMTVHKAKGLEWEVVYIIDCTENSFPLRRHSSSLQLPEKLTQTTRADDHYNEERRLMYVAVTRAKNELVMTYSNSHNGVTQRKPSRFLIELFGELEQSKTETDQIALRLFEQSPLKYPQNPIPAHLQQGKNLVLTASQINDYFRCPLDFKYRHIIGVPAEPSPQAGIGTLYHDLLQQINTARQRGETVPKLRSLEQRIKDEWPQEGFFSAAQRDRALQAALNSLPTTYDRLVKGPIPVSVEEPFRITIPDAQLTIRGRLDVVLPLKNGVEIRDYKTSTNATTPEKAKRSTQNSKQLEIYALAWHLKHGEYPTQVTLDFVQTGQTGTVRKKPATIDGLQEKLIAVATAIRTGQFKPGYNHDFCRHPSTETE
jgi:DNA helicase-2/ATP-dependent DNA helicase PcrA